MIYDDLISYLREKGNAFENIEYAWVTDFDGIFTLRGEQTLSAGLNCGVRKAIHGIAESNRTPPLKRAIVSLIGDPYSFVRTGLMPDKNPSGFELKLTGFFGKGVYLPDILKNLSSVKLYDDYIDILERASDKGIAVIVMTSSLSEIPKKILKDNGLDFFAKGLEVETDREGKILGFDYSDPFTRLAILNGINNAKSQYISNIPKYLGYDVVAIGNSTGDLVPDAVGFYWPIRGKPEKRVPEAVRKPIYVLPKSLLHEVEKGQSYASSEIGKQV